LLLDSSEKVWNCGYWSLTLYFHSTAPRVCRNGVLMCRCSQCSPVAHRPLSPLLCRCLPPPSVPLLSNPLGIASCRMHLTTLQLLSSLTASRSKSARRLLVVVDHHPHVRWRLVPVRRGGWTGVDRWFRCCNLFLSSFYRRLGHCKVFWTAVYESDALLPQWACLNAYDERWSCLV